MDDLCGIEDSEATKRSFLCHRDSPGIFPAQWSLKNGVPLSPPPGLLCSLETNQSKYRNCEWFHQFFLPVPYVLFQKSFKGYQGPDFDWADYLKQCEAEAAPQNCFPTVSQLCFSLSLSCQWLLLSCNSFRIPSDSKSQFPLGVMTWAVVGCNMLILLV